jgi:hypothetical protein
VTVLTLHLVFGDELMAVYKLIAGEAMPRLRVLVLTSPPWGVYTDDHDVRLTDAEVEVCTFGSFDVR